MSQNLSFFTEETSADVVNSRMSTDTDPRLKQVMASLVKHLHAFAKDIELKQEEWDLAVDFLTKTGQICSDVRQEFILLSDILGFSMLVDAINNRRPSGATENTIYGPFHVKDAPIKKMGDSINLDGKGEMCLYQGRVTDIDGNPIQGACVDAWSDNADGFYDVQKPDEIPQWNNRGRFITGADGTYSFVSIKPVSYPIPDDGPVGQLLGNIGRHPYRPAHMHLLVTAPGYKNIVTQPFVSDDPYIEDDAVFGVKETLVIDFDRIDGDTEWRVNFDFVMVQDSE